MAKNRNDDLRKRLNILRRKESEKKTLSKESDIMERLKSIGKQVKNGKNVGEPVIIKKEIENLPEIKPAAVTTHEHAPGSVLEKYTMAVDNAEVEVIIQKTQEGLVYHIELPKLYEPTVAMLDYIRNELLSLSTFGVGEIIEKKSIEKIKAEFIKLASNIIKEKLPNIKKDIEDFLIGNLIHDMLGLGKIEYLINDINLEEIVLIGSKEPVRVYHKKYGWLKTNILIKTEEEIINYSNIIGRRVGRQISVLNPLLDAHIITGDRANAVLYPISHKGNTITIRKFARDPWTIIDLINNKTCTVEIASLLWLAMEFEMNIIFSGGTASGKTSFLNACLLFIPPNHRIISIEDTRELILPDFMYWCPLVTRTANPEGKGEVTMLDLLVNSLRMRPDRIILGEMRRKAEAEVLFEAMHTGHSVYATLHADTAAETADRLTNPPISVPANLLKAINLNVVMFRDRRRGIRRVSQIGEFIVSRDGVNANIMYRWVPDRDEIKKHNDSVSFFEDLERNTGMDMSSIKSDVEKKIGIFKWLIKHNIRSLDKLGKVINLYYANKDHLFSIIKKDNPSLIG